MPRSSGTYTAPSNAFNPAVTGATISSTAWNAVLADLEAALTASIAKDGQTPTTAVIPFASGIKTDTIVENSGGTGVTIDSVLLKDGRVDATKGGDIASATTTDIGAATGNFVDITGTTTITGLGTITAGAWRICQFDGALTLTHNASSLILPTGANITTAAGDVAGFVSLGSGNWVCVSYQKADGGPLALSDNSVDEAALKDALIGDFTEVTVAAGDSILLGDANDGGNTKRDTIQGILDLVSSVPAGYLFGLELSNGTDASHDIDISVGVCRNAADDDAITLASALTKQIDATWSAGDAAGGLSSSLTAPANDTWYHVHAIIVSGSADIGFDTSITATNLVADHSATAYRRIGSVLTDGSANILAFYQNGDEFWWKDILTDSSSTVTSTPALKTLRTPLGIQIKAHFNINNTTNSQAVYVHRSPDVTDAAATFASSTTPLATTYGQAGTGPATSGVLAEAITDTSSRIKVSTNSSGSVNIATIGWVDTRGRA